MNRILRSIQLKRFLSAILCACILCCATGPLATAVAEGEPYNVRLGFFAMEGYHEIKEDGTLGGYGYDFTQLTTRYANLNYEYVGYDKSWEDMLQMLLDGEIDMVTSAHKTPEREALFDFSEPIGTNSLQINTRASDTRFIPGNYSTYDGMVLGLLAGSTSNEKIDAFAKENKFSYEPKYYESTAELAAALKNGEVDAVATSSMRKIQGERILSSFNTVDCFAIVRKGDTALLEQINYAINQMNSCELNWKEQLFYNNYTAGNYETLEFTETEKEYIRAHSGEGNALVVAFDNNWHPFAYLEDGAYAGAVVDIFDLCMQISGMDYVCYQGSADITNASVLSFEGVDVYTGYTNTADQAATEGLLASDGFLSPGTALLTKRSASESIRILALCDNTPYLNQDAPVGDGCQILKCSDSEAAAQAVLDGEADAAFLYSYEAERLCNHDSSGLLVFRVISVSDKTIRFVIPSTSDHTLISILQKCLKQISDTEKSNIVAKYVSYSPEKLSLADYISMYPRIAVAAVLIVLTLVFIIVIVMLRGSSERRHSRELEGKIEKINDLNALLQEQRVQLEKAYEEINELFEASKDSNTSQDIAIRQFMDLMINSDANASVGELVRRVGQYFGADRAYIFEEDPTGQFYNNTYEWCAEGVNPEIDNLQNIPVEVVIPWMEEFRKKGCFYISCDDQYAKKEPIVYEILEPQGIASLMAAPLIHSGEIIGFLGVDNPKEHTEHELYLSVSASVLNHEILAEAQRQIEEDYKTALRKSSEEAKAANSAKTSFLFNMSHDIRTPINAIMGFRTLLEQNQENPAKRQDYLGKIEEASNVLLSIINNVLEMARIEKGTLHLENAALSADDFVDRIATVFREMMDQKNLRFTSRISVKNHYVMTDETKLREIIYNLLSNACKYTRPGGSVDWSLEELPCEREGWVRYQFRVKDTGIGMTEEFLEHIFEEFSRENNTTEGKIEGTGLGMPIVKRLVDLMNGTIDITSKRGEGSEFVVTLPFEIAKKTDSAPQEVQPVSEEQLHGKRILVAEDNDLNAEIATELLQDKGMIVERAEDGRQCVDMLKKAEPGYYDLILMDIQMPNMNGYEATKAIRSMEDEQKKNIKIIAMTANAFEEDKKAAYQAGMNGHLSKPVNVSELTREMAKIIYQ